MVEERLTTPGRSEAGVLDGPPPSERALVRGLGGTRSLRGGTWARSKPAAARPAKGQGQHLERRTHALTPAMSALPPRFSFSTLLCRPNACTTKSPTPAPHDEIPARLTRACVRAPPPTSASTKCPAPRTDARRISKRMLQQRSMVEARRFGLTILGKEAPVSAARPGNGQKRARPRSVLVIDTHVRAARHRKLSSYVPVN